MQLFPHILRSTNQVLNFDAAKRKHPPIVFGKLHLFVMQNFLLNMRSAHKVLLLSRYLDVQ